LASIDGTCLDDAGNRLYRDPRNPTQLYASVTSILNIKSKPGLGIGLKNQVATFAAKNRKELATLTQAETLAILKDEKVIAKDWQIAGEFGTAVHQVVENIIYAEPLDHDLRVVESTKSYPVSNTFTEFVPQYWGEFVREHNVKPIMAERSVVNTIWGYAGRFDTIAEIDGEIAIIDTKSNKNGPKPEVALQNSAYSQGEYVFDFQSGKITPLPRVTASYVLWIREEGWNLFPLKLNDRTFDVFLEHLFLFRSWAYEVDTFVGPAVHSDRIQPVKPFYR